MRRPRGRRGPVPASQTWEPCPHQRSLGGHRDSRVRLSLRLLAWSPGSAFGRQDARSAQERPPASSACCPHALQTRSLEVRAEGGFSGVSQMNTACSLLQAVPVRTAYFSQRLPTFPEHAALGCPTRAVGFWGPREADSRPRADTGLRREESLEHTGRDLPQNGASAERSRPADLPLGFLSSFGCRLAQGPTPRWQRKEAL